MPSKNHNPNSADSKRKEEEIRELKIYLSQTVKPWFEEGRDGDPEAQGIPLRDIRQRLDASGVMERISHGGRQRMLEQYDANKDGMYTYPELEQLFLSERPRLNLNKLTRWQQLKLGLVSTVVPENATEEKSLESYIEAYNCKPPPLFIIFISVLETIIFIVYAVELKGTKYEVTAASGFPAYSPLIYNPARRYEVWRFVTYMCIHVGYTHLISNLVFQLVLGIPMEMVHEWWRMMIVYFLGVFAGSLAHSVTDPSSFLAGASGGVYALIGAQVGAIIMNWEEMQHRWMEGAGFGAVLRAMLSAVTRLIVIGVFVIADVGIALWKRYGAGESSRVSYAAHIGGAVAGVLMGTVALKNLEKKPWELKVWWISLVIYLLLVSFALFWNSLYPGFPGTDWTPCCLAT
ncbi:rhomboid-related protein 2 [Lingula anatina]|uniref:Rhomboid-related protein 2 n=1 Tax=Lingula anatina TaxID=7574 RepID=A0A1S3IYA1_LINAN|nr:rhomboid-related protein 2 [Lingula anatina]|eukprot:XP_013403003.1 rhomboid-related protein 2 [Lingula anatina]